MGSTYGFNDRNATIIFEAVATATFLVPGEEETAERFHLHLSEKSARRAPLFALSFRVSRYCPVSAASAHELKAAVMPAVFVVEVAAAPANFDLETAATLVVVDPEVAAPPAAFGRKAVAMAAEQELDAGKPLFSGMDWKRQRRLTRKWQQRLSHLNWKQQQHLPHLT